jgi:FkbM family methyltransferase
LKRTWKAGLPRFIHQTGWLLSQGRLTLLHGPKSTHSPRNRAEVLKSFVAHNRYGGYCIPQSSHHRPTAQAVLSGKAFESEMIEFVLQRAGRGDIVHTGVYFGDFLRALSGAYDEGATVWAFEPNAGNFRCASLTVAINGLSNVVIRETALASHHGRAVLRNADEEGRALGGASHLVADVGDVDPDHCAAFVTLKLDDAIPPGRPMTILHLDVEGSETAALAGGLATIRRCHPMLILETPPDPSWISTILYPLG